MNYDRYREKHGTYPWGTNSAKGQYEWEKARDKKTLWKVFFGVYLAATICGILIICSQNSWQLWTGSQWQLLGMTQLGDLLVLSMAAAIITVSTS